MSASPRSGPQSRAVLDHCDAFLARPLPDEQRSRLAVLRWGFQIAALQRSNETLVGV